MRLGLALLLLAVSAPVAHAELMNGNTISFDEFRVEGPDGFAIPGTEEDQRFFLNSATCECSRSGAEETSIVYNMSVMGTGPVTPAEIWVGTGCDLDATRMMTCRKVGDVANIYTFNNSTEDIEVKLYDLVNSKPGDETMPCKTIVSSILWVLVDEGTNGSYELYAQIGVGNTATSMPTNGGLDTTAPTLPENIVANASEEAVRITWDVALTDQGIYGYQAFCAQGGLPVFTAGQRESPKYRTAALVCGGPVGTTLTESPVAVDDAGEPLDEPLPAFTNLDATFLCGEAISPTASSLTIQGLENDVPYEVALVVIDDHGNYTGTWFTSTVLPKSVTDLWEDIHDRGGGIQGGCLGTTLPGDGGPFGGLLVGGALLIGMKMRRRRRTVLAAGAVVATLAGTAAADDFRPYWEEETQVDDGTNLYDLDDVRWHVGIKVGPYIPDIDGQVGVNPATGMGPYEAMFGDWYRADDTDHNNPQSAHVWQILPMLDVDYVLWRGFGQLTVGGTIGYMQKSAKAYEADTSPNDPFRPRSESTDTTFRLIPLQANVGYRFTYVADTYGIPIVPFVKGGLGYYMWLMRAPSGDLSNVDGDKAKGASLGFVGSIGLAVRAENIDRDSARSMRETGVDHAGFYVEWSLGKVDGFGASDKLSVGDSTFFGGFDFEF